MSDVEVGLALLIALGVLWAAVLYLEGKHML
jgi:hypothetical protein